MIDWRDTFARAIADCRDDTYEAEADAILAAIAAAGYRLHREHDWEQLPTFSADPELHAKCRRCGQLKPGLMDRASCEGPA